MYRALLVCNSRFPHDAAALVELHGPKTDGIVLRDALTHHETGIFDKNDVQVVNEGRSHEVSRVIDDFFSTSEPDDTLLLYYSGHGRTMDQQLFLCTQDTVSDRLYSSAVSGETLKAIVSSSRAQAKVLILDCCYGGMMKGELALEGFRGNGRYIIAATSATDLASDASRRGLPSPFTEILAEALLSGADDDDGDGSVDLDDLYAFLTSAPFGGPRPHRIFDGSGTIPIARRRKAPSEPEPEGESPPLAYELRPSKLISADGHMGAASFLDTPLGGISFDAAQVAEFRRLMREDVIRFLPDELAENEFLQEAGFLRNGQLTYAGLLLFGERPTTVLPSAMIQCVRFYGNEKTDSSKTVDLQGPISELIIKARDFIADLARLGEQPTTEGAYAETVYRYPMIAVREIIANAVVHRDYQLHESCVQILVFADRIEVISPGAWGGTPKAVEGPSPISNLQRHSQRRNFRLAHALTWSRLVEGVGAGIPRILADCQACGAPEPLVVNRGGIVSVTIYPQSQVDDNKASSAALPAVWGRVPARNPNFSGRDGLIQDLRQQLAADGAAALLPHTLHGLGGVGKTQLAVEYAHKFARDYQVVWWIRSDNEDLVRAGIAALGPSLNVPGGKAESVEGTAYAVLEALRRGEPYDRWLLIFDNAEQPDALRRFMPSGPGHVLVTSRDRSWAGATAALEVDVFRRAESLEFLRLRLPGISAGDAERIAEELGDLPLALDQASSFLRETGLAPDMYLNLLAEQGSRLLAQGSSADYPYPVAAVWSLSTSRLRSENPEAVDVLRLCAFLGPSPIPIDWLRQGSYPPDAPIRETVSDPILLATAVRSLGRYSLAKVDNSKRTLEVHRIIQRLIRDGVDADERPKWLHDAHQILVAADPGDEGLRDNWPVYDALIGHIMASDAVSSRVPAVRQLVQRIVDYLQVRGNSSDALPIIDQSLIRWTEDSGPDDPYVQSMSRARARVLGTHVSDGGQ